MSPKVTPMITADNIIIHMFNPSKLTAIIAAVTEINADTITDQKNHLKILSDIYFFTLDVFSKSLSKNSTVFLLISGSGLWGSFKNSMTGEAISTNTLSSRASKNSPITNMIGARIIPKAISRNRGI